MINKNVVSLTSPDLIKMAELVTKCFDLMLAMPDNILLAYIEAIHILETSGWYINTDYEIDTNGLRYAYLHICDPNYIYSFSSLK
jgi:hypothetical protein